MARLRPGDRVLFQGGVTYSAEPLMPPTSGAPGKPITFGSFGRGDAELGQGVWFRGKSNLGFNGLTISGHGNVQGSGDAISITSCTISNISGVGLNAMGSGWTIQNDHLVDIGGSGMLVEGSGDVIVGNVIANTGWNSSISYGKHGIYLRAADTLVSHNRIIGFSDAGISARFHNGTITDNYVANGPIGIAWFQDDPVAGTSHWTGNQLAGITEAGIFVSPADAGGVTRESFVIEHNRIEVLPGAQAMNLKPTRGSYTVRENHTS